MALEHFRSTPLPLPTKEYDPQYMRQLLRTLELYFNQLDALTPNQASTYRADEFFGGDFYGETTSGTLASFTSINSADLLSEGIISDTLATTYATADGVLVKTGSFGPLMAGALTATTLAGDGTRIVTPRGNFISEVAQTAASTTAAYAVNFESNTYPYRVTLASNSRMTCAVAGVYNVNYNIQFFNSTVGFKIVYVWLRKNGVDIPLSTRRHTVDNDYLVAVASIMVGVAATDYIEVVWNTSSTAVSIQPYAVGAAPVKPTTPAAVVSVVFSSAEYPPPIYIQPISTPAFALTGSVDVDTGRTI